MRSLDLRQRLAESLTPVGIGLEVVIVSGK